MYKIEENRIVATPIIGSKSNNAICQIETMIDLICGEDVFNKIIDIDFFDINGSVLLYGIPGIGKTTIAMNCIFYCLEKYGIEAYTFKTSDIIVSNLGESTQNLHKELEEFASLKEGILFIDEIDRLCINRNNKDEVSELKRMLIELMNFLDTNSLTSRKIIIACTNVIDQLDSALIRRFSIVKEIEKPLLEDKRKFTLLCMEKCGIEERIINNEVLEKYMTMDEIKSDFREAILSGHLEDYINSIVGV